MRHAFDSAYYATAATIIPVLYVALTLQGSTFEESLRRYRESVNSGVQSVRSDIRSRARVIGSLLITLLIGLILTFGIYAEFVTLLVLYRQAAGQASALLVMIAISLLLVLVAAVPIARFCVTFFGMARSDYGR